MGFLFSQKEEVPADKRPEMPKCDVCEKTVVTGQEIGWFVECECTNIRGRICLDCRDEGRSLPYDHGCDSCRFGDDAEEEKKVAFRLPPVGEPMGLSVVADAAAAKLATVISAVATADTTALEQLAYVWDMYNPDAAQASNNV